MERNMDLVRQILLEIEKQPWTLSAVEISVPDATEDELLYHLLLLNEAGLIDADVIHTFGSYEIKPVRLTWAGHESLDAARDQGRWKRAKDIGTKVGGVSFEILKDVLVDQMKKPW